MGVVASKPLNFRASGATGNFYMLRMGLPFQVVRIANDRSNGGAAAVEALWKRLAPQTTIARDYMDDLFNQSYANFARVNRLFGALALVAGCISIVGLLGIAIQVAGRRVRELGVRKSVGAHTNQLVAMLVGDFLKPVLIANVVVWPFAYVAAQQYLNGFIQRIPLSAWPFVLSLVISIAVASIAVGTIALRAARVSPASVLRTD